MQTRIIQCISIMIVLALAMAFSPYLAQAVQSEPSVQCIEGQEPLYINNAEHTTDCQIDDPTDLDQFNFHGEAGTNIRVLVSRESGSLRPHLEIWDPNGDKIVDTWDQSDISVDLTLVITGTYLMAVSDYYQDNSGLYILQLEKIPPVINPPGISYDSPMSDEVNHSTDMDFFVFENAAGTNIRVLVSRESGSLRPHLEIWDPNGDKIVDTWDQSDISVDLTLVIPGTYLMAISDHYQDNTGDYDIEIQCLTGSCPGVVQPLACDIQMSQEIYIAGDTVTAQIFRLANPGPDPVSVEWKVWLGIPLFSPISVINTGADGSIVLSPGFDIDFGPLPLFPAAGLPIGSYEFSCRIINPVTGRLMTLDLNPFEIQ